MVNRFINFRVYNKQNKCFIKEDICIHIQNNTLKLCAIDEFSNAVKLANQDNYILMQSTGIADKNGKEIFEGDIVKDVNEIYTIEYIDKKCGFSAVICKVQHKEGTHYLLQDITSDLEVIGNIYENSDLMKK